MSKRLNVALLYGGKSGEHEVSLVSAASVFTHLDRQRFNIIPIGIDKEGRLFLNDEASLQGFSQALPVEGPNATPLASLVEYGKVVQAIDVIFPVLHGPLYEDGAIQGLFELGQVAYVGCDILSSALGMDKDMARKVACHDDIKCVGYKRLSWFADNNAIDAFCDEVINEFGFPLFVKPCRLGSSVGTHKANDKQSLKEGILDARRYDKEILVEAFIKAREIEVAVLENKNPSLPPRTSIPGEIKVNHRDGFYSYTAKYLESDQTELLIPSPLSAAMAEKIKAQASAIFMALKCQGLARVDFFVDEALNKIYFNEINTLPGFTSISMYPKMWEASGLGYRELLSELVDLALIHHACRTELVTHYQ